MIEDQDERRPAAAQGLALALLLVAPCWAIAFAILGLVSGVLPWP